MVIAVFLMGCGSQPSSKTTGAVTADPDNELTAPRELREGAPVMEIPADEYNKLYNSDAFVEVTCPDGRQGIELVMAHWKEPCYVSQ